MQHGWQSHHPWAPGRGRQHETTMTPGLQSAVWRFKALGPPQLSALAGHWPSAPCPASGQSPFQGGPTGSPKGSMPSGHGGCYTQAGPTGTSGRWPCPPWLPNTAPSLAQMAGHNWAPWQRQSPSHKERGVPGKKDMSCIFQLSFVHSRAAGTLGQRLHRTLAYPMDAVPASAGWRHTNTQHRGPGPSVAEPRGLPAPKQQRGKRDVLIPVQWAGPSGFPPLALTAEHAGGECASILNGLFTRNKPQPGSPRRSQGLHLPAWWHGHPKWGSKGSRAQGQDHSW